MTDQVHFLSLDDVLEICTTYFGSTSVVRDVGLLGSAVARPQTTIGLEDAYPSLIEKAAALLQSIVINHALIDGNKRMGWLATAVFLDLNNIDVAQISNDEVFEFVMNIASTNPSLESIAKTLEQLINR